MDRNSKTRDTGKKGLPALIQQFKAFFADHPDIVLAFLFGSHAREDKTARDWDFAVQWAETSGAGWDDFGRLEKLRVALAQWLKCDVSKVDIVDLARAPLAICVTVAEEGLPLKGEDKLSIFRFYQKCWSMQEEFHWRKARGL